MTSTNLQRRPKVSLPLLAGGLVLAYLPSWLPPLARQLGVVVNWGPAAVIVWNWLAVGLLAVYVLKIERLNGTSLRLIRPTERDLEWGGWLGGLFLGWQWLSSRWVPQSMEAPSGGGAPALVALGPLTALALVLTVAFTEEVLWRGYVVERLGAWVGPWVAAAVSLV